MQVTVGGPYTHDDPHQRGAAQEAAKPLFGQKNHIKNYYKLPKSVQACAVPPSGNKVVNQHKDNNT